MIYAWPLEQVRGVAALLVPLLVGGICLWVQRRWALSPDLTVGLLVMLMLGLFFPLFYLLARQLNQQQAIWESINQQLQSHNKRYAQSEQVLSATVHELENYKQVLDKSALVSMTDPKGIINHVNDRFCQVSGYRREELLGQNHNIVNSAHQLKEFFRELWFTISQGRLWRGEIRNRTRQGTYYWVDTIINPIFDQQGNITA